MCGLITLTAKTSDLAAAFRLSQQVPWEARYKIPPTTDSLIVRDLSGERIAETARWGLLPRWAKDASFARKTFNARSETVAEKPSFRDAFRKRRCLVPTTGFFEWEDKAGKKIPRFFHLADRKLFSFAGLWESWQDPESGDEIRSFTILTLDSNSDMAPYHHRMPLVLENEDRQREWLEGAGSDTPGIPAAQAEGTLVQHPVRVDLGRASADDPSCVVPVAEQSSLF